MNNKDPKNRSQICDTGVLAFHEVQCMNIRENGEGVYILLDAAGCKVRGETKVFYCCGCKCAVRHVQSGELGEWPVWRTDFEVWVRACPVCGFVWHNSDDAILFVHGTSQDMSLEERPDSDRRFEYCTSLAEAQRDTKGKGRRGKVSKTDIRNMPEYESYYTSKFDAGGRAMPWLKCGKGMQMFAAVLRLLSGQNGEEQVRIGKGRQSPVTQGIVHCIVEVDCAPAWRERASDEGGGRTDGWTM